jgi:putative redox protein
MYAQRKNWPLEKAEVELEQSSVPDSALTPGQTNPKRTLITKKLQLTGDLTPEQVTRLKDISSRCPVQRTLENGLTIETVLV